MIRERQYQRNGQRAGQPGDRAENDAHKHAKNQKHKNYGLGSDLLKAQHTALYERLSRDDEQAGESNSIQNQKKYLEEYARQHGLRNIRHFYDDGYSGTNLAEVR